MNAIARKTYTAVVEVEEPYEDRDAADRELAFLREEAHRKYLHNLVRMGSHLAHRTLHHDDFEDRLRFLNAVKLSPAALYERLKKLDAE